MLDLSTFVRGCVETQSDLTGWTFFSRLTAGQMTAYERTPMFTAVSRQSAGIVLSFRTNGDEIRFYCRLTPRIELIKAVASMTPGFLEQLNNSDRNYKQRRGVRRVWLRNSIVSAVQMNNFELLIDGQSVALVKAIKGEIILTFDNPERLWHRVDLYFPLLEGVMIKDFTVSGDVEPIGEIRPRLLFLGDSITQGCLSAHPAQTYVNLLAETLGFEAINQGIANCWHLSEHLTGIGEMSEPHLITIAYGTNDWSTLPTLAAIRENIRAYYRRLNDAFPGKPIFAISPIWRADMDETRACGSFDQIKLIIEGEAAVWPNMTVIDGLSISPDHSAFYSDLYLHPNEAGFAIMSQRLAEIIGRSYNFRMI